MAQGSLLNRVVAKGIDLTIALVIAGIVPRLGWLAAVLYVLVADGISEGRSPGKRLLRLAVLGPEGEPCGLKDSIIRNIVLGAGVLLLPIKYIGWLLLAAAIAVEFLVLLGSAEGVRLGDELAGTRVVGISGDGQTGEDDGDDTGPEEGEEHTSG